MPTFKPVVLKGAAQLTLKKESNIKIAVIHHGKSAYIATEYYIQPKFMLKSGYISDKYPDYDWLNTRLNEKILKFKKKLIRVDAKMVDRMTVQQIKQFVIDDEISDIEFFSYCKKRISEIRANGNTGTAASYEDSVKRFKEFVRLEILPFEALTKRLLESFIAKKKEQDKALSSINIYIRSLRALFNDAKDEYNKDGMEEVIVHDPFRKLKVGTELTKFRNIDIEYLKKIRDIELTGAQEVARDMSMLMFYLIGINVKDLFYCKGLIDGRLTYKRSKGGKEYYIKVEPEAMAIIDKYKGEKYLLKFADHCKAERKDNRAPHVAYLWQYTDHRNFNDMINRNLKHIAENDKIKFKDPLSTYYFRFAWGNIAQDVCNISLDIISMCYGHAPQDKKVTKGYVREKLHIIDEANRMVLDAIK
jgi:site-specific recombinase XerD